MCLVSLSLSHSYRRPTELPMSDEVVYGNGFSFMYTKAAHKAVGGFPPNMNVQEDLVFVRKLLSEDNDFRVRHFTDKAGIVLYIRNTWNSGSAASQYVIPEWMLINTLGEVVRPFLGLPHEEQEVEVQAQG